MRFLLVLFLLFCNILSYSQKKETANSFVKRQPSPHKAVNDFDKFLTEKERDSLEDEIAGYRMATGNSIVFISLASLTDPKTKKQYSIEQAALLYFNTWGIGDSKKNNGVLLLLSRNPRRIRIEVGKGLTDILTDNICQTIVDDKLVPNFKQHLFYSGIKEAVKDIISHLNTPQTQVFQKPAFMENAEVNDGSRMGFGRKVSRVGAFMIVFLMFFILLFFFTIGKAMYRYLSGIRSASVAAGSSVHDTGSNDNWSPNDNAVAAFSSFDSSSSLSVDSSPSTDSGTSGGGSSDGGGASGSW
jgi:uncharacterized protein